MWPSLSDQRHSADEDGQLYSLHIRHPSLFPVCNIPLGKKNLKLSLSEIIVRRTIILIGHPSTRQIASLKTDKDKCINTEVYSLLPRFRKLTNKFTASGLQARASLETTRLANFSSWPFPSGKRWRMKRSILKVSGDLHIMNYIHFNKLKKIKMTAWFGLHIVVLFQTIFQPHMSCTFRSQAGQPTASAEYHW